MQSLTTGEIAEFCGVNQRTVIRWIDAGHLKGFKLPGRGNNRVRVVDYLDFLDRHGMPLPPALRQFGNRVLVVDDDHAMADSIARTLRMADYEIQVVYDGFRAGEALHSFMPAAMTLDLRMPGLDGFGVLAHVRQAPSLKRLRVLVISALEEAELARARAAGADACLAKPFEPHALLEHVQQLLPERQAPRVPAAPRQSGDAP